MPMRWTPENDQTLLLKIIEVSNVTVDTRAIAERWPTKDGEEGPTARAITERLHKIKAQIKANGGNITVTGKGKGPVKDPLKPKAAGVGTPRKPRAPKKEAPPTPESAAKIKQENEPAQVLGFSGGSDSTAKSDSSNNSDSGSSQHEPLTPASNKRKPSFDVVAPSVGARAAREAEDVPNKRPKMAEPAPQFHHSFGGMPMSMPMPMQMQNFGMDTDVNGFQYMDQNEA